MTEEVLFTTIENLYLLHFSDPDLKEKGGSTLKCMCTCTSENTLIDFSKIYVIYGIIGLQKVELKELHGNLLSHIVCSSQKQCHIV